jgi:hypothetical protein
MHFGHSIESRKGRAWAVLIALAILGILIVAFFVLGGRSRGPFDMDELYGILD